MSETKISDLSRLLRLDSSEMLALLEKLGIKSKSIDDTLTGSEKALFIKARQNNATIKPKKVRLKLKLNTKTIGIDKTIRKVPQSARTRLTLKPESTRNSTNVFQKKSASARQIKDKLAQDRFSAIMQAKEKAIAQKSQIKKNEAEAKKVIEQNRADLKGKKEVAIDKLDRKEKEHSKVKTQSFTTNEELSSKSENDLKQNIERKRKQQELKRAKVREQTKERLRQAISRVKSAKRGSKEDIEKTHQFEKPLVPVAHEVKLTPTISVSDLARQMAIKQSSVVEVLMNLDMPVTANQAISQDIAMIVIEELGHNYLLVDEPKEQDLFIEDERFEEIHRNPVITIMGHVDHGKTTLLDTIRQSKVTRSEAGGITQHIGAYQVKTKTNQLITFLDTPGHEAFSAMRARGANVTDIVVLVVAADDSVMPRTIESIQHAKAAGVPIIVAINKIDKPGANSEKVIKDLSQHGVMPEQWGGDNLFVNVSALKNKGIDKLLEAILLQAEMLDLKAPIQGRSRGVVVESRMEKGKGAVVTALVTSGTLKKGDIILCGLHYGKIRLLNDDLGKVIKQAVASTPVEILGLSGVCEAGDDLVVLDKEKDAKEAALKRQQSQREIRLEKQQSATLDSFLDQFSADVSAQVSEYNLLVKADVSGSVEAINSELKKLSNDEVLINIVGSSVGGISETDVNLAIASGASIIGFNVRSDSKARAIIEREGINLKYYSIIYELIDDITAVVKGLQKDEYKDKILGIAEVRDVFRSPKMGNIAGCMVTEGSVKRSQLIRVLRDKVVVYEGELESLRRIKDDVAEVKKGIECGIGVKNYNDIKAGDQIEVYQKVKVARD